MATRFLLVGLIMAGMSSCATYRSGQTPDDVYYSPERPFNAYVEVDRDQDDRVSFNDRNLEDRRLRQQIRDPRFRFEDDLFWNTPRFNSWGWNTWNDPHNIWGWNNWNNPHNSWGWNNWNNPHNSWGWNNGWNMHGFGLNNRFNSPFIFIPGSNNLLVISGPGRSTHNTGIRYSAPIQRFNNAGTNYNYGKTPTGTGSRYFNNNQNTNSTRRNGFFGGSNNNIYSSGDRGSSNRSFGNSNSSGSSRTMSSGSSSSSGGNTRSGGSSGGRRN